MAWNIYPSETPVGTFFSESGNRIREYQLARYIRDVHASPLESFVYSGFDLQNFTGSQGEATTGVAIVDGYRVYSDATVTVTGMSADATYYLWVTMAYTGSLVTSASITTTTSTTPPANSALIGTCVKATTWGTPASSVKKPQQPYVGTYTGDGTDNRMIFLGYTPKFIYLDQNGFSNVGAGTYGMQFNLADGHTYTSNDNGVIPIITTYGFTIDDAINTNTTVYRYVVWF